MLAVIIEERKKVIIYLVIFFEKTENQLCNGLIAVILYSCNKFAYILFFYKNIKNKNHNQK